MSIDIPVNCDIIVYMKNVTEELLKGVKPIGARLRDGLLGKIKSHEWSAGHKLPSIRELSGETGVSLCLVRKVLTELAREGYLRVHQGKGVFVAEPFNSARNVAVVLPDICQEHITYILKGIKAELGKYDIGLLLESAAKNYEQETLLVDKLDRSMVAGAIIYPPPDAAFAANLNALRKRKVPFVLVDTKLSGEYGSVTVNHRKMGETALRHILGRGHRDIGVVRLESDIAGFQEVRAGIDDALRAYGLPTSAARELLLDSRALPPQPLDSPRDFIRGLLAENPGITAVLTSNEHIGAEAFLTLKRLGRGIPKDISLMSLGDMSAFMMTEPPISVVTQPYEEIGAMAVQGLFNMLSGKTQAPMAVSLEPILRDRGSVARRG